MCNKFRRIYYQVTFIFFFTSNISHTLYTNNRLAGVLTASILTPVNSICPNYSVCAKMVQITDILIRLLFQVFLSGF